MDEIDLMMMVMIMIDSSCFVLYGVLVSCLLLPLAVQHAWLILNNQTTNEMVTD